MLKKRPSAVWMVAVWLSGALAVSAGDWTRLGGPNGDYVAPVTELNAWGENGPVEKWSRELGGGYSEILAKEGRLYTMYRDGNDEIVIAMDADSGKTIWEFRYHAPTIEGQNLEFGSGPNATPLIADDMIYTVGFTNKAHALKLTNGALVWNHDLSAAFGAPVVYFGYAQSPIEFDDSVLFLIGGEEVGSVALDKKSGQETWRGPQLPISYATPKLMELQGERQLVYMTPTEVLGVSLEASKVAWRHPHQNQWDTNCVGPWKIGENKLFVSSSGEAGSQTIQINPDGSVKQLYENKKVQLSYSSSFLEGDVIYAFSNKVLMAHDVTSGEVLWKERGYNEANLVRSGDKMLILDVDGKLSLATATPKKLELHSQSPILEKPARTAPTLVGQRVFLRDMNRIVALDLG